MNEDVFKHGFKFFPNYYKGLYRLGSEERKARFALAIIEYMFLDKEPDFDRMSDEAWVWDMIEPNLKKSKTRISNGAEGKGVSKPSLIGNSHARKVKADDDLHFE